MYKTICFDNNFSNILETNRRMLTGQYLSLKFRNPFLKTGAILAFFKDSRGNIFVYPVIKEITDIVSKNISVLL